MKRIFLLFILVAITSAAHSRNYYVSNSGSNNSDGLSESTAWRTISHAVSNAKAGDVVWIKAGDYGREFVVFKNNGTKENPISFIGYKSKPGDITDSYYSYSEGRSLNKEELPTLNGQNRGEGTGLKMYGVSYIEIRNIQITNYRFGVDALSGAHDLYFENVIVSNTGGTEQYPGKPGFGFRMDTTKNRNNTLVGCLIMNATMAAIKIGGDGNEIRNCRTYADQNDIDSDGRSMDYHVSVSGSNNLILGHYAEHVGDLDHAGHGIVLKGSGFRTENNVIDNCEIVNVNGSLEFRHRTVRNNVARNIKIRGVDSQRPGGVVFRDGASDNIVEKSVFENLRGRDGFAVRFLDTSEDGGLQWSGDNNTVKNSLIINCKIGVAFGGTNSNYPGEIRNNGILNCNFNDVESLFSFTDSYGLEGNKFINNIVTNSAKMAADDREILPKEIRIENNNFHKNSFKVSIKGNVSIDPKYKDIDKNDFRLKGTSPMIDNGGSLDEVKIDFDGQPRPSGGGIDIGAFEYQDQTTGSIEADAGADQVICSGDSVKLTATGGTDYIWSTGATTSSITVRPTETTRYSVDVSDGSSSATAEVLVEVLDLPDADAGSDVTIEAGDRVTLTARGGDTFSWSTGESTASIEVSPEATTTYTVLVTQNGCSSEDSVTVTVRSRVEADAGADQVICSGDSVKLTATGGTDYIWSTGATTSSITVRPTETTRYSVDVSDGSSSATAEVLVEVLDLPDADAGSDVTIEAGDRVTLTARGGDTFSWSTGESTASIEVSPEATTTYTVLVTQNGCSSEDSVTVTVRSSGTANTGAGQDSDEEEWLIYPNPSEGIFNLKVDSSVDSFDIVLLDIKGGIMLQDKWEKTYNPNLTKEIDLSRLEKGVYFIQIINDESNWIQKVMVI